MDWSNIIIAVLALAGSAYGTYKGSNATKVLLEYRLKELEKKQDIHNGVIERVYNLEKHCTSCHEVTEEKIKVANHRIDDLEDKVN